MNFARMLVLGGVLALSGCGGHDVYLTGVDNSLTATNKFRIMQAPDDVTFKLGDEVYTGHWVYVNGPGAVGMGTATAFSSGASATGTSMMIAASTSGSGTYIGKSPDGSTLQCTYTFSQMNLQGAGQCKDSKGFSYDLQIAN